MAYVLAQPAALRGRLRPGHEYVAPYHCYAGFRRYLTASQIETGAPETRRADTFWFGYTSATRGLRSCSA